MNKQPRFKKTHWSDKLFTINNFKYDDGKFILSIGPDVYSFAKNTLDYDLTKPKQLESFLRKCFRAYWATKNK
jgi:hypothetical protein